FCGGFRAKERGIQCGGYSLATVKLTRAIPGGFLGVRRALLWLKAQKRPEAVFAVRVRRRYGKSMLNSLLTYGTLA
ncbi:hypothetical protein, partial [Klebsiella pneumoniae]|uniref:hypothetical protein n=1 Tax=Klebsiella pneumoniae TaxID=573 RepID=UPI001C6989FA